jgi:murein DD-endopeptidase MepM/ murein hydrolase activator NlpD
MNSGDISMRKLANGRHPGSTDDTARTPMTPVMRELIKEVEHQDMPTSTGETSSRGSGSAEDTPSAPSTLGSSGTSTGLHLHLAILWQGQHVDPLQVLP